jgi:hypothetical protein
MPRWPGICQTIDGGSDEIGTYGLCDCPTVRLADWQAGNCPPSSTAMPTAAAAHTVVHAQLLHGMAAHLLHGNQEGGLPAPGV